MTVREPTREQLLAQLDAVRTVITAMDDTTGARFWAQQLHAALGTRPGIVGPTLAWCGASAPGVGREPLGPCVLRHGHDGPVHQGADGAKWWPRVGGIVHPQPVGETTDCVWPLPATGSRPMVKIHPPDGARIYEELMRLFGSPLPPYAPPPKGSCPCGGADVDGEQIHAPDCPVYPMRLRAIEDRLTALLPDEARAAGLHLTYAATEEEHPTLRLTRAQLRDLVRRLGPEFWEEARLDPRTRIPPYDPITGYRTWAEVEADPPQFTGVLADPNRTDPTRATINTTEGGPT